MTETPINYLANLRGDRSSGATSQLCFNVSISLYSSLFILLSLPLPPFFIDLCIFFIISFSFFSTGELNQCIMHIPLHKRNANESRALFQCPTSIWVCSAGVWESARQGQGAQLCLRHPFLSTPLGMDQVLSPGFPPLWIITLTNGVCSTQDTSGWTWLRSVVTTKICYPPSDQGKVKGKQPRARRGVHQSHRHGLGSPVSYSSKGKVKLSLWDQILCGKDKKYAKSTTGSGCGRGEKR